MFYYLTKGKRPLQWQYHPWKDLEHFYGNTFSISHFLEIFFPPQNVEKLMPYSKIEKKMEKSKDKKMGKNNNKHGLNFSLFWSVTQDEYWQPLSTEVYTFTKIVMDIRHIYHHYYHYTQFQTFKFKISRENPWSPPCSAPYLYLELCAILRFPL